MYGIDKMVLNSERTRITIHFNDGHQFTVSANTTHKVVYLLELMTNPNKNVVADVTFSDSLLENTQSIDTKDVA